MQLDIEANANKTGEQGMERCCTEGESNCHSLRGKSSLFLDNCCHDRTQ